MGWENLGDSVNTKGGIEVSIIGPTNVVNGSYTKVAGVTVLTTGSVNVSQPSSWTMQCDSIATLKKMVVFNFTASKQGGGGKQYDFAIFKNGSLFKEHPEIKVENGKNPGLTIIALDTSMATSDDYDLRIAGNGTADDVIITTGSGIIY